MAKIIGVFVKDKRPTIWLNTDLDSYLSEQDGPGGEKFAPRGESPHIQNIPDDSNRDRRKAVRQVLSGFAVIHTLDPDGRKGRYRLARLRDISSSGIGLRLNSTDPDSFKYGREFEILFQFSEHGKSQYMACTACRHAMDETGLVVGAVFKNALVSLTDVSC
jgi:hypothetical protein